MVDFEISGPYFNFSHPYGKATLLRDEYYITWVNGPLLFPGESNCRPILKITVYRDSGSICFVNSNGVNRFNSLHDAIKAAEEYLEQPYCTLTRLY